MNYIKLLLLICISLISCSTKSNMEVLARTGGDNDLSIGWEKISLRTEIGNEIYIDTSSENGVITDFMLDGKPILNDLSLIHQIKYPDLRTLDDIWYQRSLKKISKFEFEFVQLSGYENKNGPFKAIFTFKNGDLFEIIIQEFNSSIGGWDFLYSIEKNKK